MPREIENLGESTLALCGGQMLLLPKQRKPIPPYLDDHPDLNKESPEPQFKIHKGITTTKTDPLPVEKAKTIRETEPGQDEKELAAETKEFLRDAPETKDENPAYNSGKGVSMVPPAFPGGSTDHNPAYNSGKGVSIIPPPQEVLEARGMAPKEEASSEDVALTEEEPKKKKSSRKKGKKGKK